MQRSEFRQDNLPHVPGLSNRDNNETLAIHVQVEVCIQLYHLLIIPQPYSGWNNPFCCHAASISVHHY